MGIMARQRQRKRKIPLFQFGSPIEIMVPGAIQASLKINFRDKFISWFGINNTAPDFDKINKVLPELLRVNLKNSSSSSQTKSKGKNLHRQFLIDLNKLENIASISERDKKKIRKILEDIKCNKTNKDQKTIRKPTTRRVKNISPALKSSKWNSKEESTTNQKKDSLKNTPTKNNKQIKTTRSPKNLKSNCKKCSKLLKLQNKAKRKEQFPNTTISFSQDQIFKTLIGLDPRCFGDTLSIRSRKNSSSTTIKTIYKDNKNINIKNIELKYVSPTYVVQYNTNDDKEQDDPKPRSRLFSNAVLKAHFGGPPIQYHEGRARGQSLHHPAPPMHFRHNSESDLVIGGGISASDQRAEKKRSNPRVTKPQESYDEVEIRKSSIASISRSPDRAKWQKDPLPSYLLPNDQREYSISSERPPMIQNQKKQIPMCKKCLNFLKRVLCLKGDKKPEKPEGRVEGPFTQMKKEEYLHPKRKANTNMKKTRTTEKEFFNPKVQKKVDSEKKVSILRLPRQVSEKK